ncbi:MAG: DUF4830 domain-containing protein [Tepidibacter sp.]|jgi:hypothetical protein|uniref:hypothetical protein n=1 Tax=Tepidibacter sp. TaxID=2529387 RepID=UPI0025CDB614|nr:hypothetical protein [Tepidibacter sp.]MCT4509291.1 DUF4830 domain-containing protein [Tepidibacter sp.]
MRKLLCVVFGSLLIIILLYNKSSIAYEKTAEEYIKTKGYVITTRKGEINRYTLEKNKLYGGTETIPYQQSWAVQKVNPDDYLGKEIIIYCFTVKKHPLEKIYNVDTNLYIIICDGKVIGGYSYPNANICGAVDSLDGETLEEVTGLNFQQWRERWRKNMIIKYETTKLFVKSKEQYELKIITGRKNIFDFISLLLEQASQRVDIYMEGRVEGFGRTL